MVKKFIQKNKNEVKSKMFDIKESLGRMMNGSMFGNGRQRSMISYNVRDGTGPHGRGLGPGKGKGCDGEYSEYKY